jgi:hypothetical protein
MSWRPTLVGYLLGALVVAAVLVRFLNDLT